MANKNDEEYDIEKIMHKNDIKRMIKEAVRSVSNKLISVK